MPLDRARMQLLTLPWIVAGVLLTAAVLLGAFAQSARAHSATPATVTRVVDGDTVDALLAESTPLSKASAGPTRPRATWSS